MNASHWLLLLIIQSFKGERSINGIIHLLQGKRSAQTIQDGHIYKCLPYFGILMNYNRQAFSKDIEYLNDNQLINFDGAYVRVTENGVEKLNKIEKFLPFVYKLNGWRYKDVTKVYWQRLSLLIQCLSNLIKEENRFIPITQDKGILNWVKAFLLKRQDKLELTQAVYEECYFILDTLTEVEAEIFVMRLSGYRTYGCTNEQIATKMSIAPIDSQVIFIAVLHQMLDRIESKESEFPLLNEVTIDLFHSNMTGSARQTFSLIDRGYSLHDIVKIRGLKQSTIEDHIVEIAITNSSFSIEQYVNDKDLSCIQQAIDKASSIRLREIKQYVPEHVTYFMIRLVLAKGGIRDGARK